MPDTALIINRRRRRQDSTQSRTSRWIGLGCVTIISLIICTLGLIFSIFYFNITSDLPSLAILPELLDPPDGILLQPSRLYDRTGEQVLLTLENPSAPDTQILGLDPSEPNFLPANLITATLATSDPNFWQSPGYSLSGLREGQSPTLAQNIVSDYLLWNEEPGLRRALRERLLAAQITSVFGRRKILEWHLNGANYGRLTYGANAAAQVYFGKPASELSLAEAAMLAAIAEAPALNPHDAPIAAQERKQSVINTMLANGWISSEQAQQATQEQVNFRPAVPPTNNIAPAFTNYVLRQLSEQIDLTRLERGGYKIITSLDYDLQEQVACTTDIHLARLEGNFSDDTSQECAAARLLPATSIETPLPGLAANIIIYDPTRGNILAMTGEPVPGLDPSDSPGHPSGTLLSPLVYLSAFTRGFSPASLVWDIPDPEEKLENPDRQYHGPVRARIAMANDYLEPTIQLLQQFGSETVKQISQQMGIDLNGDDRAYSELLFESGEITLLQAVQSYGILANQGLWVGQKTGKSIAANRLEPLDPLVVLSIDDPADRVLNDSRNSSRSFESQTRPVINAQLAYLINNILSDEPARWPSLGHPNHLEIGKPVAAKLGQTQSGENTWVIGYTPDLVAGVWLGYGAQADEGIKAPIPVDLAAALWRAVFQFASHDLPTDVWNIPAGINQMEVCDPSGLLPTPDCPNIVSETFLAGTEPTQFDNLHQRFQVNRETGLLATVHTPPDLVEEQIYMMFPPEAKKWAQLIGLPIPPDSYDVIAYSPTEYPYAQITTPETFAHVNGTVIIEGNASGDNFEYYRLQVGKGLNPKDWLQIGEDVSSPVESGQLGAWDTEGMNGLFALQLTVIREDQRIESDVIQITVDNQEPTVQIRYPADGQNIIPTGEVIVFQVEAGDNLSLENLSFYLDGSLIASRTETPYSFPWKYELGEHTLKVRAVDRAGNTSEDRVRFSISQE